MDKVLQYLTTAFDSFDGDRGQGAFYTVGDELIGAAELRRLTQAMGEVTGAGIIIGVVSDGVQGLPSAVNSGDLPQLRQLLPDGTSLPFVNELSVGTGSEGVKILEVIHDIAPGAQLIFESIETGSEAFRNLALRGAHIIVDNVSGNIFEPYFEEGHLARAVDAMVNRVPHPRVCPSAKTRCSSRPPVMRDNVTTSPRLNPSAVR